MDGVVALAPDHLNSGSAISGRNQADRFVMGLLRACADAVLIGAGTLRTTPRHRWTAEHIFPGAAREFQELRRRLGCSTRPHLYVLTARADVDVSHPALREQVTIITTDDAAAPLRGQVAPGVAVVGLGGGAEPSMESVVRVVHDDGHQLVLTEGGPTLNGQLFGAGQLDQLFLTISPRVFGRSPQVHRLALLEGRSFAPGDAPRLELLSVHRQADHLFLRYSCENANPRPGHGREVSGGTGKPADADE